MFEILRCFIFKTAFTLKNLPNTIKFLTIALISSKKLVKSTKKLRNFFGLNENFITYLNSYRFSNNLDFGDSFAKDN